MVPREHMHKVCPILYSTLFKTLGERRSAVSESNKGIQISMHKWTTGDVIYFWNHRMQTRGAFTYVALPKEQFYTWSKELENMVYSTDLTKEY